MAREVVLRFLGDAGHLNRTFAAVEAQSARAMGSMQGSVATASATMQSKFSSMGAGVAAAGATMRRGGAQLARNLSLPLVAIGGLGLKTAIDYERNMNVLKVASNATEPQMAALGKLAQELGADIKLPGTSAADAAQAMLELSKAGLSVEHTMAATRGVLQLSAAGNLDNAAAAEIAAGALNAFGLRGDQATRVSDLLAGAANSASGEVTDMADALKMSAAVFGAAGVPIEDLVTSTALMAKAGIQGSDAGTALKTMLMRLQDPASKEAAETMARLGIDAYDAAGNLRPMREIIGQVSGAMAKLTPEARAAALANIFGADAVRSANIVLAGGVQAFDKMKASVTEEGAAAKMAAARNKGLGGALDGLKSAMETLALKVLVPALPVLTKFVTALANFLPKLTQIPKPVLFIAAAFGAVLVAAGPLLAVFGALLSPIALVMGGILALGAAIVAFSKNPASLAVSIGSLLGFEEDSEFTDKLATLFESIKPKLLAFATSVGEWIKTNAPIIGAQLLEWGKAFLGWVLPLIPPFLERLGLLLGALGTWILETGVPWLADKLQVWIPAFIGWVAQVTPPLLVELAKLLDRIIHWIFTEALPKLIQAGLDLAAAVANGIAKAAGDMLPGGDNKISFGGKTYGGTGNATKGPGQMGDKSISFGGTTYAPGSLGGFSKAGGGDWTGATVNQTNNYNGVSIEEAQKRTNADLGWRMGLMGRR